VNDRIGKKISPMKMPCDILFVIISDLKLTWKEYPVKIIATIIDVLIIGVKSHKLIVKMNDCNNRYFPLYPSFDLPDRSKKLYSLSDFSLNSIL